MDSEERGIIHFRDRARQINNFSKLRYCRGITPTDIDGAFEFDGKMFIFFELKYREKDIDTGQRLFFERICNALNRSGRHCLCIHARHEIGDFTKDVNADKCTVVKYYAQSGRWITPKQETTVHSLVNSYILQFGNKDWLVR
jgi:hypothetical protein